MHFSCSLPGEASKRIECRITGTFDPLIQATSPQRIESSIISNLTDRNYLIPNTNTSDGVL